MTPNDHFATCVHEAGHAVVARIYGLGVSHIMARLPQGERHQGELGIMIPGANPAGLTKAGPRYAHDGFASTIAVSHGATLARIAFAGGVAESCYSGAPISQVFLDESGPDYAAAWDIARTLFKSQDGREMFLKSAFVDVLETIRRPRTWATIMAIAMELEGSGCINGARVHEIVRAKIPGGR